VHALVRNALVEGVISARRSRLHRQIAQVLEHRRDSDAATIAHHWLNAGSSGDPARTISALSAAAEQALARLAFSEAADYFERALERTRAMSDPDPGALCQLLVATGSALAASGQYDRARACYLECADVASASGFDEWIVAAGLCLSGPNVWRSTITAEEQALVTEAYARCAEDDVTSRSILAARRAALLDERSEDRSRWTRTAVELAGRSGDDNARRIAMSQHVLVNFHPDAIDQQLQSTEEIVDLARQSGSLEALLEALMLRCLALGVAGRWTEFEQARAEVEHDAHRYNHAYYEAVATLARAARLSLSGRVDEAESAATTALMIYGGDEVAQPWRGLLVQLRLFQGRLDELEPALRDRREEPDTLAALLWALGRGLCMAMTEQPEEAKFELRRAARNDFAALSPIGRRTRSFELSLFAHVASLIGDTTWAARAHELLSPYDGLEVVGSVSLYVGPVSVYLGMLERLLDRPDDAQRHLEQAIAYTGVGEPPFGGVASAELLYLLQTLGRPEDAARMQQLRDEIDTLVNEHSLAGVARHLEVLEAQAGAT
jgi:tetratricopeptide (TPR) repeat protein